MRRQLLDTYYPQRPRIKRHMLTNMVICIMNTLTKCSKHRKCSKNNEGATLILHKHKTKMIMAININSKINYSPNTLSSLIRRLIRQLKNILHTFRNLIFSKNSVSSNYNYCSVYIIWTDRNSNKQLMAARIPCYKYAHKS